MKIEKILSNNCEYRFPTGELRLSMMDNKSNTAIYEIIVESTKPYFEGKLDHILVVLEDDTIAALKPYGIEGDVLENKMLFARQIPKASVKKVEFDTDGTVIVKLDVTQPIKHRTCVCVINGVST